MRDRRKIPKISHSEKIPIKSEKNERVDKQKCPNRTFCRSKSGRLCPTAIPPTRLKRIQLLQLLWAGPNRLWALIIYFLRKKNRTGMSKQATLDNGDRKVGFFIFFSLPQKAYIGQRTGKEEYRAHWINEGFLSHKGRIYLQSSHQ
jgi:hypothetical protein